MRLAPQAVRSRTSGTHDRRKVPIHSRRMRGPPVSLPPALLTGGLLIGYAIASATALTLMKSAMGNSPFSNPKGLALLAVGSLLYALSFLLWLGILRQWPLAIAYGSCITLTLLLVTIIGWVLFGEEPTPMSILGSVLVVSGVLALALAAAHE